MKWFTLLYTKTSVENQKDRSTNTKITKNTCKTNFTKYISNLIPIPSRILVFYFGSMMIPKLNFGKRNFGRYEKL